MSQTRSRLLHTSTQGPSYSTEKAAKLLSDTSFVPVFGKAYDALSLEELAAATSYTVIACNKSRNLYVVGLLTQMFRSEPFFNKAFKDLTSSGRGARQALARLRLESEASSAVLSRDKVLDAEDELERMRPLVWPSEAIQFQTVLAKAWNRVASTDNGPEYFQAFQPAGFLCMNQQSVIGTARAARASDVLPGQTLIIHPYTETDKVRGNYTGSRGGSGVEGRRKGPDRNSSPRSTVPATPNAAAIRFQFTARQVTEKNGDFATQSALKFDGNYWIRTIPEEGRTQALTLLNFNNFWILGERIDSKLGDGISPILGGNGSQVCSILAIGAVEGYVPSKPLLLPGEFRVRRTPRQ